MAVNQTEVYAKGKIIYLISHGKQSADDVSHATTKFYEEAELIKAKGLKPVCLVDLSDNIGYDSDARKVAVESMKQGSTPTAVVGASKNVALQTVINFMTRLAGKSDQYQFFANREKAEAWLKSLK